MQAPNFWQDWEAYGAESQPVSDAELADKMRRRQRRFAERFVPFTGCRSCPAPCTMRDHGEALTFDKSLKLVEGFIDVCAGLDEVTDGQTAVRHLAQFVTQAVDKHASVKLRGVGRETVVYCLFLQLNEASGLFSPEQSRLWEKEFRRLQALIT